MIYWLSIYFFKLFSKIYFRGKAYGLENYPSKGPFIGVINHDSSMDILAVPLILRHRIRAMGKASLFRIPIFKWWLKACGAFPVERGASDQRAFQQAVDILRNGEILFMAPEGTRKGKNRRARTGFVRLAQTVGCPVVPIAVWGTRRALAPGGWFPRPVRVVVKVGTPIMLERIEVCPEKKPLLQQQADQVMAVIRQMLREIDARYGRQ